MGIILRRHRRITHSAPPGPPVDGQWFGTRWYGPRWFGNRWFG